MALLISRFIFNFTEMRGFNFMSIKDLIDLVNKEKRQKERAKAAKRAMVMVAVAAAGVAIGVIFAPKSGNETQERIMKKAADTEEIIKDRIQKKQQAVKASKARVAKDDGNDIKDVHEKTKVEEKELKK
jgi:gas vesicle protein